MPILSTEDVTFGHQEVTRWAYNALDCAVTAEVFEKLQREFKDDPHNRWAVYEFMAALQGPALDMTLRGIRVDEDWRKRTEQLIHAEKERLQTELNRLAEAIWDQGLNPLSTKQMKDFFYGALGLKPVKKVRNGKVSISCDDEALDKLMVYPRAILFARYAKAIRRLNKDLNVVRTAIDPDGRFRAGYRIAGTETGRFSSAKNAFRTGSNAQNITDKMRRMFIADPGRLLCYADLEQAESRIVGILSGVLFDDWSYYEACLSGDLHTQVCRMIWPDLGWTGDLKKDKKIAEQPAVGRHSYRDLAKRGGHGCLTTDHEVLTPNGWVPIDRKPSIIMAWSDGHARFEVVEHWTDFMYSGDLVYVSGQAIDVLMTADHRVPVYKGSRKLSVVRADELLQASSCWAIPTTSDTAELFGERRIPGELYAAIMSDGEISKQRTRFHLHKRRKVERLKMLCQKYGVDFREHPHDRYSIGLTCPKELGPWIFDCHPDDVKALIVEYRHWDGHVGKTAVSLFSKSRRQLEWLQLLGRLFGVGGNIQKPYASGYGGICYRLQQNKRKMARLESCLVAKWYARRQRVICPTVPSSFFFVRRNGKISVTGNSNYAATPVTMAKHLGIETKVARQFQEAYFKAFPGIKKYQSWVRKKLAKDGWLTTPLGRTRYFFGRLTDADTIRKAIAFIPQSSIADILNRGLLRLWKEAPQLGIELLAQVHDAVLFQFPEDRPEVVETAKQLLTVEFEYGGKTFSIPVDAQVGRNWAHASPDNPEGIK